MVCEGINLLASDFVDNMFPNNQQVSVNNFPNSTFTNDFGEIVLPGNQQQWNNVFHSNHQQFSKGDTNSNSTNNSGCNEVKGNNQSHLYSENTYYLNKSRTKWISVGMSANLYFDPVIRLMGKGQCITLTQQDWKNLINSRQIIMNSFVGDLSTPSQFVISGMTCSSQWIENVRKVLKIERRSEIFYIAYDSLHELWKLSDLISSRVDLLRCLNYKSYYSNFMEVISSMQGDVKCNILTALNGTNSEEACVTKELLVFGMDKILLDIDLHALLRT